MALATLLFGYSRQLLTRTNLRTKIIEALAARAQNAFARGINADGLTGVEFGAILPNHSTGAWSMLSAAGGADKITVNTDVNDAMVDRDGAIVEPGLVGAVEVLNAVGVKYIMGYAAIAFPDAPEENINAPGTFGYAQTTEIAGYEAAPGAVTDLGGNSIEIIVDSLLETGDNSGLLSHTVRVILKPIESGGAVGPKTVGVWFEDRPIIWDGVNNVIRTTTYLGQSAPSVLAADYQIILKGPVIRTVATGLPVNVGQFCRYTGGGAGIAPTSVINVVSATAVANGIYGVPGKGGTDFLTATILNLTAQTMAVLGNLTVAGSAVVNGALTTLRGITGGTSIQVGGLLANEDASAALGASSIVETEGQTVDLPANTLTDKTIIRIRAVAALTYNSGIVTLAIRMGDAAAGVATRTALLTFPAVSVATGDEFEMIAEFRVVTPGAVLNLDGFAKMIGDQTADTLYAQKRANADIGGEDGTAVLRISPTITFSASHAANNVVFRYFTVEVLGG